MSDLAVDLALPDSLKYLTSGLKASSVKAKVQYQSFAPEGANNFDTTSRTITIPIASNSAFLDTTRSYLSFKVSLQLPVVAPTAAVAYVAPVAAVPAAGGNPAIPAVAEVLAVPARTGDYVLENAFELFDELAVISSGGAPLEVIPHYGTLVSALSRSAYDLNARAGADGTIQGFSSANGYDGDVCKTWKAENMTRFEQGKSTTIEFAVPLPCSSVFTMGHSSGTDALLLPLAYTNGLKLRLQLKQNVADIFMCAKTNAPAPTRFTVEQVRYNACLVQPDSSVVESLRKGFLGTKEQSIMVSTSTWRAYRSAVNADDFTTQIGETARSIKSLLLVNTLSSQENNITQSYDASLGGMSNLFISIGADRYPQVPIDSDQSAMRHLAGALGQPLRGILNTKNFASGITRFDDGANISQGVYGIDMESFASKDGSTVTHGMSNYGNGSPIAVHGKFPTPAPAGVSRVQKVFSHVDALLVFNIATRDQTLQV